MWTTSVENVNVPDVPDISAEWYLDIAGVGADSPEFVHALSELATEAVIGGLALLFLLVWWRARSGDPAAITRALLAPVVTMIAYLLSESIKMGWQQDRPCRVLGEVATIATCPELGDWSFPSNHSTIAGAAAVAVLWSGRLLGGLAAGMALFAAASRVFVGVHYPHDVVAGLLLGATIALLLPLLARVLTPVAARLRNDARAVVLLGPGPGLPVADETPTVRLSR